MGVNKKIICLLVIISILSIGVVNAADADDYNFSQWNCQSSLDTIENDNFAQDLNADNRFSSYNDESEILKETIDFDGNTLSDLQKEVDNRSSGDVIVLKNNLTSDGFYPVSINKSITIDGNGHAIDVQGKSRIFDVTANGVSLKNITFVNAQRGVAIYANHANGFNISYCNFINNNVELKNGSAIYLYFCDDCIISHCTFNNSSGGLGNVNLYGSFWCNISDCTFENNYAVYGGAIFLSNAFFCNIDRCSFKNNTAYYGGGVALFVNSLINVVNCAFEDNFAGSDGGAVDSIGASILFNNCTFKENIAGNRGGAICWTEEYGIVNNCSFVNNSAVNGSAIYFGSENNTVSNSTFLNHKTISHMNIDNSTFGEVVVTLSGNENYVNAICSEHDVTFTNVTYWNGLNVVTDDNPIKSHNLMGQEIIFEIVNSNNVSSYVTKVTNADGQVILDYLDLTPGNYTLNVYHTENDYTTNVSGNCTFTANSYGEFDILQLLIASTESSKVLNLSRDYAYSIGKDTITEGIVINKPITIDGNGHTIDARGKSRIFNILSDNVKIMNLNLINASYGGSGGAIYWKGDKGSVDKCSFINNSANNGSAIYFESENNYVSDSLFLNNTVLFYFDVNDQIFGTVTITLSTNENYINAIYSEHRVKFNEVTYWDGKSIVTSDDPIRSQYIIAQEVILEIRDDDDNLINITNKTNFYGQVILNYLDFPTGQYWLKAYVPKNSYTPYLGGNCTFFAGSYGDFDLLQTLIVLTEENDVLTLSRNYTYDLDWDRITNGIVINKPITIDGNGYTIDAQHKSRIFEILGDNVKIKDLNFVNSTSNYGYGGVIYCEGDNAEISLCTFKNCDAYYGGAIYLNGFNCTISYCLFSNSSALRIGGAIYWVGKSGEIYTCIFENNSAEQFGGALYLDFTGTVSFCDFKNNSADYGGAIDLTTRLEDDSYCIIYYCGFDSNVAGTEGGAISFSSSNYVSVRNSNFSNNHAFIGGALSNLNSTNAKIDNCTFKGNVVERNGGAIYSYGGTYNTLNNCYFANNSGDLGAVIYWIGDANLFNDLIFENNVARDSGIIFWQGNNNLVNASVFRHNSAKNGGGVHFSGDHNLLDVCVFEYNSAIDGGAVHWNGNYNLLRNSIFKYNVATNMGGAIYWACQDSLLHNCSFINNSAFYGGAIYVGNYMEEEGNNIVNASVFRYNAANVGGAIYWNSDDSRLMNSVLEYNVASDMGGAIYYTRISMIYDSILLNNKANATSFDLNVTSNTIKGSFSGKENYINAIYSECSLIFLNVTYWNGDIVNTDDMSPKYSVLEYGVNITLVFYDAYDNIIGKISLFTDENGTISYEGLNGIPFARFEVSHFDDNYYNQIGGGVFYNTRGAFDCLKDLIENSAENSVINLNYDYIYDVNLDNLAGGIVIDRNMTINGNGHVIDARHKTGIFKINADNVVLNNVTFINAGFVPSSNLGAIEINASDVKILDCGFINNSAVNGGAVYVNGLDVVIDGCTFINNSGECGGVIYLFRGNISINKCIFGGNAANSNGVIYCQSNASISNCTFEADNCDIYVHGNIILINNIIDVAVYNHGNLYLTNNVIDKFIYNSGSILSQTYIIVLNNSTVLSLINNTVNLFAQLCDDNSNSIMAASKLSFVLSNGTIIEADFDENALLTKEHVFTQDGTYQVSVNNDCLDNCKMYAGTVEVYSVRPVPELVIDIDGTVVGQSTVITVTLPDYASGNLTIIVDGIVYLFGSSANLTLDNLTAGNHTLVIIYSGDSIFAPVTKNMSFIINNPTPVIVKIPTMIVASNFQEYAIDYKAGERGKYFKITLKDDKGNPISNKKVIFTLNGKQYSITTNSNGIAQNQISLQKAGNYKITISFSGDDQYVSSSIQKNIKIIKKKTKIVSKKMKSFKKSIKVKKLTVTLKTIKGSSINGKIYLKAGKKLTLKIKGKIYKAKTNKKGKAVFKIKKFYMKGVFKAVIKFKGDNIYKSSSKKIKIKIK